MLDFIWSFAIIAGTVTCFITHGPQEAAGAITDGAASAVELCIFMAGLPNTNLTYIGLATPLTTIYGIVFFAVCFLRIKRKERQSVG